MNRVVVDPGSELCKRHNEKMDKYEVSGEDGVFTVVNTVNNNSHNVEIERVSNLEFYADCDCEDWNFRRKNNGEPCVHVYAVVFEAAVNDSLTIPEHEAEESAFENVDSEQQTPSNVSKPAQEEAKKSEVVQQTQNSSNKSITTTDVGEELGKVDIETVKRYIAPKECTDTEVKLFCNICAARGANPFLNEAYLVKYRKDEPARTIVSKEFFLKKARAAKDYKGFRAGIILKTDDGAVVRREGSFIDEGETLLGGWCEVYLDGKEPVKAEVNLERYMKTKKDGKPNRFWAEIPETMIRKVALTQALREAFPEELGGLYGAEEQRDYQ